MRKSALFTALILFAAACFFYFGFPPEKVKDPENLTKENARVLPVDEKSPVVWMQIQNLAKNQTVTMQKKGAEWKMLFPVAYPAETLSVDSLVTALKLSARARRLMPEKDWEEYGLLKPFIKVGIQTETGAGRRYLYIGEDSPVGPYAYARWEGEKEYFLVQRDLKRAFDRTVYSLREKRVFRVPLKDVTKMRIRSMEQEYEIEKRPEGWYWLEPIRLLGKPLQKKYVDQIITQYGDLFVKEFLDSEKRSEQELGFGLLSPWIKLIGQDKTNAVEQITIGQEMPERDSFVARREGEQIFFLVARENVRKLFQIFETMVQEYEAGLGAEQAPASGPSSATVDLRASAN